MKKVFFTLFIVCFLALYSNAQFKPEAGSITTEVLFTPFSITNQPINNLGIKGRYYFSDNLALRLNLDFGMGSEKSVVTSGSDEVTTKSKASSFMIAPGIEYHMGSFERISPYIGAQLIFSTNSTKQTVEGNQGGTDFSEELINGGATRNAANSFGLGIGLGFDYYIVNGLYIGAEYGLEFLFSSIKPGETSSTFGGTTNSQKFEDKLTETNLSFVSVPQIRLGWRF